MNKFNNLLEKMTVSIKPEIDKFQEYYLNGMLTDVKLINSVVRYIAKRKGKQFRPKLCILSAKMCGEVNENTYKAASLIEMIHVATLIHDDVVDDSNLRRGWPSVNRIWKNKVSILVGDYLFSNALSKMYDIDNRDALKVLSDTAKRLSEGEIMQVESAMKKNLTEEKYLKMIKDKTSSLMSAATLLGAISSTHEKSKRDALYEFGEKLGTMFQIKDDLIDITGLDREVGKPTMFDLKKNMLTLPIIYIISQQSKSDKKSFFSNLKYLSRKNNKKEIKRLIIDLGGIEYSEQKISEISNSAIQDLSCFPDSDIKSALMLAINFNMERRY